MPMYAFRCESDTCTEPNFESLAKMDQQEIACPSCGSKATRKEVAEIRRLDWYSNAASVRFHFNYTHN